MSDYRRDSERRLDDGGLTLQSQVAFLERESKLLEVLERRRQPRRRQDVKGRLVAQWKQTLALSSAAARRLVTDAPPAPKPVTRRPPLAPPTPPKPPKPMGTPGRTVVSRIRRETDAKVESDPVVATAQDPVVATAQDPVVATTPDPRVQAAPQPPRPIPSRWIPTLPSLSQRIAEVAVQTAGTVLLALAMKAGRALFPAHFS